MVPNCSGDYFEDGMYGGGMSYKRDDDAYYLWRDGGPEWNISTVKGGVPGAYWWLTEEGPEGVYEPQAGAEANATATLT